MTIFRSSRETESEKALIMLSKTLLEAICREAIRGEACDSFHFQESMRALCKRLDQLKDPSDAYLIAGKADSTLQEYYTQVTKHFEDLTKELQSVIAMLFATVSDVSKASAATSENFKALEKQLLHANDMSSLHDCRIQINRCLLSMREEAQRQRSGSTQIIAKLKSAVGDTESSGIIRSDVTCDDPVSGLPSRYKGEESILACSQGLSPDTYFVVFVVHRINLLNSKYGHSLGDSVLRSFLRHLMISFADVDELYRWSGPAFLAFVHRKNGLLALKQEVSKTTTHRLEETIMVDKRELLIPISASGLVLDLRDGRSGEELIKSIDSFAKLNS